MFKLKKREIAQSNRLKELVGLSILIITSTGLSAQYVRNTSFENSSEGTFAGDEPRFDAMVGDRTVDCCYIEGKFRDEPGLEHWTSDHDTDGCQNDVDLPNQIHSPDWFKNGSFSYDQQSYKKYHATYGGNEILAHSGHGYVGLGQCELIQQKLKKGLRKDETYYLDFFFRPGSSGNAGGICGNTGRGTTKEHTVLKVYITKGQVKYSSASKGQESSLEEYCEKKSSTWSGINKHLVATIDITSSAYNFNEWNKFSGSFSVPRRGYNWVVIEIEHPGGGSSYSTYLLIDDFRILDNPSACNANGCLPSEIYTTSDIQSETIRDDYILAYQNAKVVSGEKVKFQAENSIRLRPDFHVERGGDFVAKIDECKNAPSGIRIVDVPNIFTPNGDGMNDELCVVLDNARSYELDIYNRWGTLIAQKSGSFVGNKACMWTGQSVSDGTYYMYLKVSNECVEMDLKFWVQVSRTSGYRLKAGSLINDEDSKGSALTSIKIYPNPSSGMFNLKLDGFKRVKSIEVRNIMGKVVAEYRVAENEVQVDLSTHAKGLYYVKISDGVNNKAEKVIVE